jgi:hypothetical protein
MRRTAVSNSPRSMQPPRAGKLSAEAVNGQYRTLGVSDDLDHVIDCRGARVA